MTLISGNIEATPISALAVKSPLEGAETVLIIDENTPKRATIADIVTLVGQGTEGKSAYQAWLDLGNEGTEQDFINYLRDNPIAIQFSNGDDNPFQIIKWDGSYFDQLNNGRFLVQFKDDNGNLVDRPDIGITRTINRTDDPENPYQYAISFDSPGFPDGQLLMFYSKFNII